MPTYEMRCLECGVEEDHHCSYEQSNAMVCECGGKMTRLISPVRIIGPTDTKPDIRDGKHLVTASQVSAYEKANPGLVTVSKSDRVYRDESYARRHKIETRAQAAGHRSEKDRLKAVRKNRERGL